jgi:hypothetical protein
MIGTPPRKMTGRTRGIRAACSVLLFLQLSLLTFGVYAVFQVLYGPLPGPSSNEYWYGRYDRLPPAYLFTLALGLGLFLTWSLRDRSDHPYALAACVTLAIGTLISYVTLACNWSV